jgi:pimeloyl-ACP methyl ester carboxylesterase
MELFFRQEGSGEPLIILHGLFGSSDNWMSIAKKLAKKYTVYLPDQRNHGHSPHSSTHSYDDMKNDLAEFMDTHKIGKATLLGHSMGGKVAIYFAADYPERVEKLIVADIAPKDYSGYGGASHFNLHLNIMETMLETDFSAINSRNDLDKFLSKKIKEERIRQFLLKNAERDKATGKFKWRLNTKVLYDFKEEIAGGVNKSWLKDHIPIVAYPVVFIKGENSDYIKPEDEIQIKEIYPDARIVVLPNAGHWLHAEQPELFIKTVLEYP